MGLPISNYLIINRVDHFVCQTNKLRHAHTRHAAREEYFALHQLTPTYCMK